MADVLLALAMAGFGLALAIGLWIDAYVTVAHWARFRRSRPTAGAVLVWLALAFVASCLLDTGIRGVWRCC
jgi:hypothetical protein